MARFAVHAYMYIRFHTLYFLELTGQLHLPCQHTEVYGDQRGWSEADHENLHRDRQTDLDLEKEVT